MPLLLYTCLLWLLSSGLWTVQAMDPNAAYMNTSRHHRVLASVNADFAFSLYKHLVALSPKKNVFISPVSISMALAMLSLGTCGHTRAQLLHGLGFNLTEKSEAEIHQSFQHLHQLLAESDSSLEMTLGNALFLDGSLELLESFSADIKHYYESEVLTLNFQDWATTASRQINGYVKSKTQGKIDDLFSGLNSPAVLILINYIFFKGTWKQPFDLASTREENFYVDETTVVKVPMMFQSGTIRYLHDSELPCQLVQLNYAGNGTVFFILPEKGKMNIVITALSRNTIDRWSAGLTRSQVDLYIPKVTISGAYDFGGVLEDMGIADLFTNHANFSRITQDAQLKLSKVFHKAVLQLSEEGVNTTGSTGVTLNPMSKPIIMRFNQPFLIMVFDHFTWSSLFLGRVVNPA
ncbi:corticosteroid-binding globulin [Saimiri boliviensis]|uniref:Corticosteroid-binding globulin n=2 Tax=Saimiri TaxID=9520 RepID=CBG_SAISC|nr:corticosteroid-binding globulin [Saimiri boliviensis boliviensis]P50451.1 RecName: Full=Corticosteroid-binding globulin; Short=CBG; AltName: Full=Serpin A6; AltName: Full=Transcortin; Flags: Precursor [Saimiri sciureus]AAC60614.1 corticosteroid-binding globulin [Saimiri sciureus]